MMNDSNSSSRLAIIFSTLCVCHGYFDPCTNSMNHGFYYDSQTETPRLVVPNPPVRPNLGLFQRPLAAARSQGNYWVSSLFNELELGSEGLGVRCLDSCLGEEEEIGFALDSSILFCELAVLRAMFQAR
ncbi:hypothetical protein L3X38_032011 [Prunus dulcis]|uniref:Uncharacterized protein n=1 Tax=Prunus dulcis TaxID=3755 RepID=A0AAD4VEP6_PRUDU|nr:hypothetical protein L3X38_032008 [Prunus dulcis]KAI5322939.1 hypothetical protein L3X38_032011 [Prunus dulcis]